MRKNARRLAVVPALGSLVILAAACGSSAGKAATGGGQGGGSSTVKVNPIVANYKAPKVNLSGMSFTITSSKPDALTTPLLFALEKLREWGAHVNHVVIISTSGIQTMIAGKSNVAAQGADEVILGRAEGAKVVAFGSHRTAQPYVLVAKNKYKSVASLKGATIAMSGPSGFDTLLGKYALRKAGIGQSAATFTEIGGSPDRATALLAGRVDAATIFMSDWLNLKSKTNKIHELVNFGETTDFPGSAIYAMSSYLQSHQKLALGIACANLEANAWVNHHESQYVQLTLENVQGETKQAAQNLWKVATGPTDMWPTTPDKVISTHGFTGLMQAMLKSGEITHTFPLTGVVNTSYLQKAAAMGCASGS